MKKTTLLLASPNEQVWGWRYLAFQTIFLSWLLVFATVLLGIALSSAGYNFLYFAVNFIGVLIIFHRFLQASVKDVLDRLPRVVLTAAVFFVIYEIANILLALLLASLNLSVSNVNDQSIAAMTQDNYLLMAIGTVFLVPLAEECLLRAAVFGSLRRRHPAAAYLVSTALFCLIHISGYLGSYPLPTLLLCFVQYVPAGLCLAAAYEVSGSIFAPILIHTAVNTLGMLAMR